MRYTILFLLFTFPCSLLWAQSDSLDLEKALEAYPLNEQSPEEIEQTTADDESVSLEDIEEYQTDGEEIEAEHTSVDPEKLEGTIGYKAEKVVIRKFDSKKWKAIVGNTNYEETPDDKPKEEPEEEKIESESKPWNSELLRMISFALIIAIIVALLYYILKNISVDYKVKKKSFQPEDFIAPVQNIEDLDIHALLQQTLAQGNLRLALRLYYLDLLKRLNTAGLIVWKRDKTNRDYLAELFAKENYYEEVRRLTLAYEQVWYGEHSLTSESFEQLSTNFETVHQKLNTLKPL